MTSLMFIAFGFCRRISKGLRLGETTQEIKKGHHRRRHRQLQLRHYSHHHQLTIIIIIIIIIIITITKIPHHHPHHHHHHHNQSLKMLLLLLIIMVKMLMTITKTISISLQVDPLYDSRRGHRDDYDGTFPEYSSHVLPPVERNQQRKQDTAGGVSKG